MSRIVYCVKLKKEGTGLANPPYPGEMGQKIFQQISQEAWELWLKHQVMLINEYRLSTLDPDARQFLLKEMENFLFGDGSQAPSQYVPVE